MKCEFWINIFLPYLRYTYTNPLFIIYHTFKLCPAFSILSGNPMSSGIFLLASPRQQESWLAAPCSAAVASNTSANFVIQWATATPSVTKAEFGLWVGVYVG